jgi:hypothetical protein
MPHFVQNFPHTLFDKAHQNSKDEQERKHTELLDKRRVKQDQARTDNASKDKRSWIKLFTQH